MGLGIAKALARRSCNVVLADINIKRAEESAAVLRAEGANAIAVQVDVGDRSSVENLADVAWDTYGSVEMIFNNAGIAILEEQLDTGETDLQWIYNVNFFGVWYGCSVFGKRFIEAGRPAWICNTGSEHSLGAATPYQPIYTSSKHAVLGLSDSLRQSLPDHIGISVLCPGIVNTNIWESDSNRTAKFAREDVDEDRSDVAKEILTHGADPDEVGENTVKAIEEEDFFIFTHSNIRMFSHNRDKEVAAASDKQVPTDGELRNETVATIQEVMKGRPS